MHAKSLMKKLENFEKYIEKHFDFVQENVL